MHRHRRWRARLMGIVCLVAGIWAIPVRPGVVLGESMAPSFHNGQLFLMSRLTRGGRVARGDVVVFDLNGETFIKRVFALPGEAVWGIDWAPLDGRPDYLLGSNEIPRMRAFLRRHPSVGKLVQLQVPADHVFVVGDAAGKSVDSRQFGPVPREAIRGRLMLPS